MPVDYFAGLSQETLEEALEQVQADLLAGKVTSSWSVEGSNVSKQIRTSPEELYRRIKYSLYRRDPVSHPLSDIKRLSTLVARFRDR